MSFILDALKKSEAERQRQAGPALLEMRIVRPQRHLPPWAVAVGVLLVVCVLVLGWLTWRSAAAPPVVAASSPMPAAGAVRATGAVPATGAPFIATASPAGPGGLSAARPNSPGESTVAPGLPAAQGHEDRSQGTQESAVTETDGGVADSTRVDEAARNPADVEPAVRPGAGTAHTGSVPDSLPSYSELIGKLPELRLDLHVYSAKPAERYAFINMHKVREGDVTAEGLQVREITRDGVVLDYRGTEFLLGRQ